MTNPHMINPPRAIKLPLSREDALKLNVGDLVTVNGNITVTLGLPTHQRMLDNLAAGTPLPVDLQRGALLHLGSYNQETERGFEVLYLNPSTSTRYNAYMPGLIRGLNLGVVGGKGGLSSECVAAMQEVGCVYLSFLGGGCTLLSRALRGVVASHWNEYISHFRLVTLAVESLGPATVAIDARGNSVYESLNRAAHERAPLLLDELRTTRGQAVP